MQTLNKIMNKIIFTSMFIAAVITWMWMIFAWIIAIIGG
tara:strand:+ start:423 stop:539 length:117 start_codon:yes stop_codon:yes gene_type:complete